jgi:high affinity Mn2+ porin
MKNAVIHIVLCLLCSTGFAQPFSFSRSSTDRVIEESQTDVGNPEKFNIHFQSTYIYQYKPAFTTLYSGKNSLSDTTETQNSLTATLYLGARLWKGAAIYANPELAGGSGLSGALGMAGSSNGETFRVGNPSPTPYIARAYFVQTISLQNRLARKNGELNTVEAESAANQLAGYEAKNYVRCYLGKLSLADLFDKNEYSNSPRTQFMNWALMNNGAWDYAANTRGYTYSVALEAQLGKMNFLAAAATMPLVANGPDLNFDVTQGMGVNAQVSRVISVFQSPLNLRVLGYYNTAPMGNYTNAMNLRVWQTVPDIAMSRATNNTKYGLGLNFDYTIGGVLGVFGRAGWNDGQNETWCFTEIDRTVSLGLNINGYLWQRRNDNFGIAGVINALSDEHRYYLFKGGMGFILGDGTLNYAPEMIGEAYYSFRPLRNTAVWVSADYQFCVNPGYNSDRGPVHIFSGRLHVEL